MEVLKKCPFCGETPNTSWPFLMWQEENGVWVLSHNCHDDSGEMIGSVTVYGKTAEEVFKRWNDRIV
jgi:hypothetical protein